MKQCLIVAVSAVFTLLAGLFFRSQALYSANTRTIIDSIPTLQTCFYYIEVNSTLEPPLFSVYFCDDCSLYVINSASESSNCISGLNPTE